jgi:hypothetical protein
LDGTFIGSRRKTVSFFFCSYNPEFYKNVNPFRLEIQAKVRQLRWNTGVTAQQNIETAREQLTALVQELKNAMHTAGVVETHCTTFPSQEPLAVWDEIVNEPVPGGPNTLGTVPTEETRRPGPIQIEEQIMPLPSNGNAGPEYAQLELSYRILHAENHLNRIRDLIAEKSFQFSHVIRVAPRKAVNTRSRAEVKKINMQISVHCRSYTQCRVRLIGLGASAEILNKFQLLTTDDIKASTAIVNPNEPGSTRLKLSWIWQSAGSHRWDMTTGTETGGLAESNLIECTYSFSVVQISNNIKIFGSSTCSLASSTGTTYEMARRSHIDWIRNAVDSPVFPLHESEMGIYIR